jgi:hypothetical protein
MIRRSGGVLIAAAVLLAGAAQAEVKWVTSPRAEKVNEAAARRAAASSTESVMKRELWKGSKAIILDQETKQLRKPTMAEVAQMVQHLRKMTSRPARAIASRVQSNGVRQGSLEGDQANVVVARATEDGQYETLCVQTFDEAADFLGLVRVGGGDK